MNFLYSHNLHCYDFIAHSSLLWRLVLSFSLETRLKFFWNLQENPILKETFQNTLNQALWHSFRSYDISTSFRCYVLFLYFCTLVFTFYLGASSAPILFLIFFYHWFSSSLVLTISLLFTLTLPNQGKFG